MTPDEKLDRIVAKCREIIAPKNKRTPGVRLHSLSCDFPEGCSCGASEWNALSDAFVVQAGRAEAMARSTIAAIDLSRQLMGNALPTSWNFTVGKTYLDAIMAAWPEEML